MLSFKPAFHSSFSPLLKSSFVPLYYLPLEWYHLHIWGCWYFSLQSWFQIVLHPAWHFTWCMLHITEISRVIIYSLDILLFKFKPVHCSMSGSVSFWPTYMFLRSQVRWSAILISKNFPQFVVFHTVKGFSIATEEVDVFLKFPCFLYDPMDTGNLVSGSSACISGSSQFTYCWSLVWKILSIFLLGCEMSTSEQ